MNILKKIVHKLRLISAIYSELNNNSHGLDGVSDLKLKVIESEFVSLICQCSGIDSRSLAALKKYRKREYVYARQLHMAILRVVFKKTLDLSGFPYYKDHATVLHSIKTVKNLVETNTEYRKTYLPVFEKCLRLDPTTVNSLNLKFLIN